MFENDPLMKSKQTFQHMLESSPDKFCEELRQELQYFHRTKIITLLDIYRTRVMLLPMLDVWLAYQKLTYEYLLKPHEDLLLYALRCERSLADINQMINENKYILRNSIKTMLSTLPDQ